MNKRIKLGHVAGVHGVKGWVKIHSLTDPRSAIFDYQPWLLGDAKEPVRYSQAKEHGKRLIALFENVNDREQAESLVHREIWVDREQLPEPGDESYYWADLVGLTVRLVNGELLGTVSRLMETGANDVLVVDATGTGKRQHLVPFVQGQYVKSVDLDKGELVVDWDTDF